MMIKILDKALEDALSLEEDEVKKIWQKEHVWWSKNRDQDVAALLKNYTRFVKEGQPDPKDTYKHGLSLLSEDESHALWIIFTDAKLDKKCPILQLTLLGYIDSIVYSLKRHKDLKFPTEYKEYVRRVREIASGYYKTQRFLTINELHVPTHPADYVRSIGNIAIPIPVINKIFALYGFEAVRKKSKHGEKVSTDMIFGISDDHERTLALFDYYVNLPNNSI